jgi:hypothetical protein
MISKDDFADVVHRFVHDFYDANPARMLNHTFIGATPEGDITAIQVAWGTLDEKLEVLMELHQQYKELGVCMYAYVGEAWGSKQSLKDHTAPSQAADRFEMVSVLVHAKMDTGKTMMTGSGYYINRDGQNHITKLVPMEGQLSGTQISMLMWDKPLWHYGDPNGDGATYRDS